MAFDQQIQPVLTICDRIALPLCLFDSGATLLWCNECVREMAKCHARKSKRDDGSAFIANLQRRLKSQIGLARSWPSDRVEMAVEGLANTIIELFRIIDGDAVFVAGLFIRKTMGDRDAIKNQLTKLGLTITECRIAKQMLCGLTTVEMAQSNNISVHTLRTHIKHIYSKLGIHCREKMLAKIPAG